MKLADGITQEDLKLFLQEADEQIQVLDQDIIRLENESENSDLMQEIFRAAHTLKGSSAMVGHQRMSELAHAMESVLDNVRHVTLAVNPRVIDALLHGLDVMRLLREELVKNDAEPTEISDSVAELTSVLNGGGSSLAHSAVPTGGLALNDDDRVKLNAALGEGKRAYDIEVMFDPKSGWASVRSFQIIRELSSSADIIASDPSQQEIEGGNAGCILRLIIVDTHNKDEIKSLISSVPDIDSVNVGEHSISESTKVGEQSVEELVEVGAAKPSVSADGAAGKGESRANQTIRIDVDRLDVLMEQVGELVVHRNQLSQLSRIVGEKYGEDEIVSNLAQGVSQIGKMVSALQWDVMKIRLQPVEIVFNTLPRMVRDLARKMNKKVDFIMEGKETEVDRSVIEHLRDPLIHLLRNAVDHGIETPEKRIAVGKPETGTMTLCAYHDQDKITIKLTDDGKGIDAESLRQAAVSKGFRSSDVAVRLSDEEAINLIFDSGFSTAKEVSEVSGRGVGLDVVRTNIEALGGTVNIASEVGHGSQFTLTLPLTLAIMPALLVVTGETTCAIPLSSIIETDKLEKEDIKTICGKEVTVFRGSVLPLLRLGVAFGREEELVRKSETAYMVVVQGSGSQVGIIVDALLEQQELVVKPLDDVAGGKNIFTGTSILSDGRVGLIIDVPSLVRNAVAERHGTNGANGGRVQMSSMSITK